MGELLLSIISMFLGPLLYSKFKKSDRLLIELDSFIVTSISLLLFLHLLESTTPQNIWIILGFVVLGFLGPALIENKIHTLKDIAHYLAMIIGGLGLLVHAALDGIVLNSSVGGLHHSTSLSWAIILHRLPAGLLIWHILTPLKGKNYTIAYLILMSTTTTLGFMYGKEEILHSHWLISAIQALVAGSLMHVLIHHIEIRPTKTVCCEPKGKQYKGSTALGTLGGLAITALIVLVEDSQHIQEDNAISHSFFHNMLDYSLKSAPALLLAYAIASLLYAFSPKNIIKWASKGGNLTQTIKGIVVGMPLPICSCGVLPLFETMIKKGLPQAAGIAFLIATPEIGIEAALMSFPLLGTKTAIGRILSAGILALTVGIIVSTFSKFSKRTEVQEEFNEKKPLKMRLREGIKFSLFNLFDKTAPWIFIGLTFGALLTASFPHGLPLPASWLQVPIFSLIGSVFYVCAAEATPIAAGLIAGGLSPGAAIAFLLTGPATNISTFGVLSRVYDKKTTLLFSGSVIATATALGFLVNAVLGNSLSIIDNSKHAHFSPLQYSALIIIAILFLSSLLRKGPRKFFAGSKS